MSEVIITNSKDEPIHSLYQWDANQVINVRGIESNPIPAFNFGNRLMKESISVRPILVGTKVQYKIPNELLECHEAIVVYAYQDTESERDRTVYEYRIPVIPRAVPSDYVYTNNTSPDSTPELIFVSNNGDEEYCRVYVEKGTDGSEPVSSGFIDVPEKNSSVKWDHYFVTETTYEFNGWSTSPYGEEDPNALLSVDEDRVLYAVFSENKTKYAVPYPDINRNRIVDINDVKKILEATSAIGAGEPHDLTEDQLLMADVDCDGLLTLNDAVTIQDFYEMSTFGFYENSPEGWNKYVKEVMGLSNFHTVEFYNEDELLLVMKDVPHGGGAVYCGAPPLCNQTDGVYKFERWDPVPKNVTEDMKCHAKFVNLEDPDNFIFGTDDDGATAVRYVGTNKTVYVPKSYSDKSVAELSPLCFSGIHTLEKIVFPDNITEI